VKTKGEGRACPVLGTGVGVEVTYESHLRKSSMASKEKLLIRLEKSLQIWNKKLKNVKVC